jgi:hypothetical protein
MDKKIIFNAIYEGNEKDLLDKLKAYQIDEYNNQLINLIKILLVLIEKGNDHITSQQYFHKVILSVLPQIVSEESTIKGFVEVIRENAIPNYAYTSTIVRQLIIAVIDRDIDTLQYSEDAITEDKIQSFKSALININVGFLDIAILNKFIHDDIISIFYSCVATLEAERKTIIALNAIDLLRKYLLENPEDYLKGFIRPLYSGGINKNFPEYFLHVAEPFHGQIFDENDFPITDFFKKARGGGVDEILVSDVERFYFKVIDKKSIDGNKSLLLGNQSSQGDLVLKSNEHKNVRPELIN